MKMWDIALKDLVRSFRSAFAVTMMFVAPLLMTAIFYFALGGLASGSGLSVPATEVQVVNLDRPAPQFENFALGKMLTEFLQSDALQGVVHATAASDGASAREAVNQRMAGVAIILPENLTKALLSPEGRASITLIQDPTLSLGPGIVKGIISQFVDGYTGARIAANVFAAQARERGIQVDVATAQDVALQYGMWASASAQNRNNGQNPAIELQAPPSKSAATNQRALLAGLIMAGMMIFFTFFTAAAAAETILTEDEQGTLARLFTTATPRTIILAGKFAGVVMLVLVQVVVLVLVSGRAFGIYWGDAMTVTLLCVGMVLLASGFGVFIMSFIKNTRQTGTVMGGGLTISGMLGGLFTTGFQNLPRAYEVINLFTPHGWALRGWKTALAGGGVSDVLPTVLVMLGLGAVFFAIGALLFRKRFA